MNDDSKSNAAPDKRFSLQTYQGILHVCEDVLDSYRKGRFEKKDVDAIMSVVTVSRQTLSDKARYAQKKADPLQQDQSALMGVTNKGPFNVFSGGAR
jgi:hypothetical protein|tara:strand:+ start:3766 stop:4056 length:291 start_codon:yes stop_codon:yes gene_type:complete